MKVCFRLICILLAIIPAFSFKVYVSNTLHGEANTIVTLSSFYTTQSIFPHSPIYANVTFLSLKDIGPCVACLFFFSFSFFLHNNKIFVQILLEDTNCTGNILVYIDPILPSFKGCNSALPGVVTAFSRAAQKRGAVGLIVPATEKVKKTNKNKNKQMHK